MKEKIKNDEKKDLILIVDDVKENLKVLGTILRGKGYKIAAANEGKKALDMVNKLPPDLILLDIMMPELNGIEVCKQLKASPISKDIPVIFLTAKTDSADVVKGLEAGAMDYISKPFNHSELLARVHTHLELKKARDRERELVKELTEALSRVKLLSGLLPICAKCKKIRDDKGYWRRVEEYVADHSEAQFSHSLCPVCIEELYPGMAEKIMDKLD